MRSARRGTRLAVLALGGALLAGGLGGCSTTQEKAEAHRAESERILEARKNHDHKVDGPEIPPYGGNSAHQQRGNDE